MIGCQRSYKLLSKTTSIYLLFTFLAFFGSAIFLTREVDQFIQRELENRFAMSEHRIKRHIESGQPLDKIHPNVRAKLLRPPQQAMATPAYVDTMIFNADLDGMQRFRMKTTVLQVQGQAYQVAIWKSMDDFVRLRDDTFEALFPAFIALALAIVLFNFFLSGYFFRPFAEILGLMKTYQVGQSQNIKNIATSTLEFKKMQDLFHQMIDRIEQDYRHLKEYTENMAHEMQTPLAIIRNKTENLIGDASIMKRHAETVKCIYQESNHLSKLGSTLNLLTKIENGEFNHALQVKTAPVIEKHVAAIAEPIALKALTIELQLSDSHEFLIDPLLLDIVIKNLLSNAVGYGTSAGPIRVRTTPDSFAISNYGPPLKISPDKLFERFNRIRPSKTSLGLGLALVKKITELNQIRIDYHYQDDQHVFTLKSCR